MPSPLGAPFAIEKVYDDVVGKIVTALETEGSEHERKEVRDMVRHYWHLAIDDICQKAFTDIRTLLRCAYGEDGYETLEKELPDNPRVTKSSRVPLREWSGQVMYASAEEPFDYMIRLDEDFTTNKCIQRTYQVTMCGKTILYVQLLEKKHENPDMKHLVVSVRQSGDEHYTRDGFELEQSLSNERAIISTMDSEVISNYVFIYLQNLINTAKNTSEASCASLVAQTVVDEPTDVDFLEISKKFPKLNDTIFIAPELGAKEKAVPITLTMCSVGSGITNRIAYEVHVDTTSLGSYLGEIGVISLEQERKGEHGYKVNMQFFTNKNFDSQAHYTLVPEEVDATKLVEVLLGQTRVYATQYTREMHKEGALGWLAKNAA